MNCKNRKIRSKKYQKYFYCVAKKKEINFDDCINCTEREYKSYKTIINKSNKLNTMEKKRFSIIAPDLLKCVICGKKRDNLHEVFYGTGKRQLSMKYGLVLPLCFNCHNKIHSDSNLSILWKVRSQNIFEKTYPDLNFLEIFGKNYK